MYSLGQSLLLELISYCNRERAVIGLVALVDDKRISGVKPVIPPLVIKYLGIFYFITDKALQPYLDQIDQLEEGVQKLEASAYKLDALSKQLGMFRFLI